MLPDEQRDIQAAVLTAFKSSLVKKSIRGLYELKDYIGEAMKQGGRLKEISEPYYNAVLEEITARDEPLTGE